LRGLQHVDALAPTALTQVDLRRVVVAQAAMLGAQIQVQTVRGALIDCLAREAQLIAARAVGGRWVDERELPVAAADIDVDRDLGCCNACLRSKR
jgi:hypothetical protein